LKEKTHQYKAKKELTLSLKKGLKGAFRELFDTHHRKIYNVSRSFNISHEDAEGVVQEVFLTVWEKRNYLNENLSLEAFLMTITKRLVFKIIRNNVTRYKHEQASVSYKQLTTNETDDYIIFEQMNQDAQECLNQLSSSKRQVFMLSKQHGMSNDAIATQLNLSKRTVENQLYRATKELKDHIKKQR